MSAEPIYHLAEVATWAAAQRDGEYLWSTLGRTLAEEGFIHCSTERQWRATRARFYAAYEGDLVLLTIDPALLTHPLRYEVGNPVTGEEFPHLYGPLPVSAVVATTLLHPPHTADSVLGARSQGRNDLR